MPRKPVYEDEVFIRAWKACESASQVDRRMGMRPGYAVARAKVLREKGVDLPPHGARVQP